MDYGQEYLQNEDERDPLLDHFQNVDINAVDVGVGGVDVPGIDASGALGFDKNVQDIQDQ